MSDPAFVEHQPTTRPTEVILRMFSLPMYSTRAIDGCVRHDREP